MSTKILVVADSHGDYQTLNQIYLKNIDCDMAFHCGDSCIPEYLLSNFATVRGNCDYTNFPLELNIETKFGVIHIEHGHHLAFNLPKIFENKYLMVFTGHTHVKKAEQINGIWFFNPGSLTRPRDSEKGSYLIVTINDDKTIKYEFKSIDL